LEVHSAQLYRPKPSLFFCLDPSAGSGELQKNQKIKAELNSTPKNGRLKQKFRQKQTNLSPEIISNNSVFSISWRYTNTQKVLN